MANKIIANKIIANKRNIAALFSLVCAWQLDLEAHEAFLLEESPAVSQNETYRPTADHSADVWEKVLKALQPLENRGAENA